MSEKPVKKDLSAVEAALGALQPTPSGVDRDRLMYLAGEAAASRSRGGRRRSADWLWAGATAASLLMAIGFATLWLTVEPEERIVYLPEREETAEPAPQPTAVAVQKDGRARPQKTWRTDYLRLRHLVMTEGVDVLPPSGSGPASEIETLRLRSVHDRTLEELLEG